MSETVQFLKKLISTAGLSGYELPVRELISEAWQPLVDELSTSRLGSLHGLRRGAGAEPRPSVLLATHMDAIGLMVTGVTAGFLRVTEIGGLDARVLPGQIVTVHGRQDLPGVVVEPEGHLLPDSQGAGAVPLSYLWVDVGLLPEQVGELVRVGDLVSFAQPAMELDGDLLVGHSLDNRASVAALTICLQELQGHALVWDVWAVATVQEEETLGGAATSAFQLRPTIALAIDVTFGSSPGATGYKTYPLEKGPTLGWGPNVHPALFDAFRELAKKLEIPYQVEMMPAHSGTDAISMQVTAEGIPTMVIGIPLRYMHTPVEMVAVKDIQRCGRLLAEFVAGLDSAFLDRLVWKA